MAGKSDYFENAFLKLIFQGIAIAGLADNAASSPITTLYLSLHTADPLDTALNGQSTNETTYTGYARVAVSRNSGGWTITGNSVSPAANIEFGTCTAGTATITHAGIGTASTGNGQMLYSGAISPPISVGVGVIPRLTPASAITED